MNDHGQILVVSTVPTVGYMLMNGLIQVGVFIICALVAYFILKRAGFNILSWLRGEEQEEPKPKKKSKKKSKKGKKDEKSDRSKREPERKPKGKVTVNKSSDSGPSKKPK
jgi:hypothetical protein